MVNRLRICIWTGLLAAACPISAGAAPMLQLILPSTAATISVTQGSNGPTQSIDAKNSGDGSLSLQVAGSAPWLTATVGNSHPCSDGSGAACQPIQIVLNTSSLAAGGYAGLVSVYDPNAVDTPQYIPVSIQIGTGVPDKIQFWIAPGASASTSFTTSSVVSIIAKTDTGTWLTAAQNGGSPFNPVIPYQVTATAGPMAVGDYNGTLTVTGSPLLAENKTIAVTLHVVQPTISGPLSRIGGALNNTTYAVGESLAQGDIVALFGSQFATGDPVPASSLPLATTLGTVQVLLNGNPVPLYYVSATQINLQVPYDAKTGPGTLQVVSNGQKGNLISLTIATAMPRILRLNGTYGDYGIIVNSADNTLAVPTALVASGHAAKVGSTLVIYAIGFGPTSPAVASGVASPSVEPLARVADNPQVCFGASTPFNTPTCVTPLFAGLSPGFVGLYQVNVTIPGNAPVGDEVSIYIAASNGNTNTVEIAIQP